MLTGKLYEDEGISTLSEVMLLNINKMLAYPLVNKVYNLAVPEPVAFWEIFQYIYYNVLENPWLPQ